MFLNSDFNANNEYNSETTRNKLQLDNVGVRRGLFVSKNWFAPNIAVDHEFLGAMMSAIINGGAKFECNDPEKYTFKGGFISPGSK